MNVQYISDSAGMTTGVFIPINEWNQLKEKYLELDDNSLPLWQQQALDARLDDLKNNPDQLLNFDEAINDIDKDL